MNIEKEVRELLAGLPEFVDAPKQPRVVVHLTASDPNSGAPVAMIFMVAHDPVVAMHILETAANLIERGAENNWGR